jgi:hypothetical protein
MYNVFMFWRAMLTKGPNGPKTQVVLPGGDRIAGHVPPQRHIDIAGQPFDGIAKFDDTFYDSLARMVSEEPVQLHDLA